jgi:hypothetical protein
MKSDEELLLNTNEMLCKIDGCGSIFSQKFKMNDHFRRIHLKIASCKFFSMKIKFSIVTKPMKANYLESLEQSLLQFLDS